MTKPLDPWPECGYRAVAATPEGLKPTAELMGHLWRRPELLPPPDADPREQALHHRLLADPLAPVDATTLEELPDPDARENYRHALVFRTLLGEATTLEAAYRTLAAGRAPQPVPPVLMDWLVQLIVRHLLAGLDGDAFAHRAGELLFRRQRLSREQGPVVADAEWLDRRRRADGGLTVLEQLIRQAGGVPTSEDVQVLNGDTADDYWRTGVGGGLALDLNLDTPGLQALGAVLKALVEHIYGTSVAIAPVGRIDDPHWRWHIGLDAHGNELLNALYRGEVLSDEQRNQWVALFRLTFGDEKALRPDVVGYPIYLGLAASAGGEVRLKPHNLLLNLPLISQ
ncbi:MAG: DUF6352 family protein [Candidatus Competibacterales bacterium]